MSFKGKERIEIVMLINVPIEMCTKAMRKSICVKIIEYLHY